MRFSSVVPVAFFLCLAQAAAGQPVDGFYLGTLTRNDRTLNVGVVLETKDGRLTGWYYYFGRGEGVVDLEGTLSADGTLRLQETTRDPYKFEDPGTLSGSWTGKRTGDILAGTWTDAGKVRKWTFRLVPAERAASFLDAAPTTRDSGVGPLSYRVAQVPESSHSVPIVTSFHDRRVMNAVNRVMFGAAAGARCSGDMGGAEHDFEAAVSFVGGGFLSVAIRQGWFCGGAYPTNDVIASKVFDLRSGDTVELDDVLDWRDGRERLLPALFPYELDPTRAPDKDCQDVWTAEWMDVLARSFHLTGEGMVVRVELAHVVEYCANYVTVPFGVLATVAKPGNPLAALFAQHAGEPARYRIHRPASEAKDDILYTPRGKR